MPDFRPEIRVCLGCVAAVRLRTPNQSGMFLLHLISTTSLKLQPHFNPLGPGLAKSAKAQSTKLGTGCNGPAYARACVLAGIARPKALRRIGAVSIEMASLLGRGLRDCYDSSEKGAIPIHFASLVVFFHISVQLLLCF